MTNIKKFEELTRHERRMIQEQLEELDNQKNVLEEKKEKAEKVRDQAFCTYLRDRMPKDYVIVQGKCWDEGEDHGFKLKLLHPTHVLSLYADTTFNHRYFLKVEIAQIEDEEMNREVCDRWLEEIKLFIQESLETIPRYRLLVMATNDWLDIHTKKSKIELTQQEKEGYRLLLQGGLFEETWEANPDQFLEIYLVKRKI